MGYVIVLFIKNTCPEIEHNLQGFCAHCDVMYVVWQRCTNAQRILPPPASALKMAAAGSSESSVVFYQTIGRHIPEDSISMT
jgi:hypothetical protein